MRKLLLTVGMVAAFLTPLGSGLLAADEPLARDSGFRGIWYSNQPTKDEYVYKYSGGLATYPQQHRPIAIYSPAAHKTFFVYGGRYEDRNRLLHMVSYYDHATGLVARPRILLDKQTDDAHDNPTLAIDGAGHLWIFSNSHGVSRPSYISRSRQPYSIDAFERVLTTNYSYGQPWYIADRGLVLVHTLYVDRKRFNHITHSADGRTWSEPLRLAAIHQGHYQISAVKGARIGIASNYHPAQGGLNFRTNLYYMQSDDGGHTWTNAAGLPLTLPLTEPDNPALAVEYQSQGQLVYLKDIAFTDDGRPVVMYLTTSGYEPGPKNEPRFYTLAEWTGSEWKTRRITSADHAYDFGSLYIESSTTWRMIGVTEPGPQPWSTGGEITAWLSTDRGLTWAKSQDLTRNSTWNHTYPRGPLNAHDDFYALWADGHALQPSGSFLYFATKDGRVFRLPPEMTSDFAAPEPLP